MSVQEYLDKQTSMYKSHANVVCRIKALLEHQYRIQAQETIPKKHRPLPPAIISSDSDKESFERQFHQQYHDLFFKNLQEAITKNTINLELEKARCNEILVQTEKTLCLATETGLSLAQRYNGFLQKLHIKDHEILPELRAKFNTPTNGPPTSAISSKKRKRKRHSSTQSTTKQMKLDSFLVLGSSLPRKPI